MGTIADEIKSYYGCHEWDEEDLLHIGVKRRSGRYPWGSGEQPFQSSRDFLGRIEELKKSGFTYTDVDGKKWTGDNAVAKSMGLTIGEYRKQVSWAGYERRLDQVETAKALTKDGLGPTEIGRKMGLSESTVRSLLNPKSEGRMNQAMETVELLRKELDEKGMIDVGTGVELELGISRERLNTALDYINKADGCPIYKGGIPQVTNKGQQTNQLVLCLPGTEHKEIYDFDRVKTINEYTSDDGGQTFRKFQYPKSIDSSRVKVLLKDEVGPDGETGNMKDGLIQIRRGVDDLSLGDSRYCQVRILVDDTKYLKGMAVYSDNIPDGYDIVFNSNKTSVADAYKKIKDDPDNPFGSLIKPNGQSMYIDKNGKEQLSAINKRADEGDWSEWADTLPSQFLSKQTTTLAEKQLKLARTEKMDEYADICALENPTIKKHLLEKFADNCDSAAVHLKAAALPGQKYHVMIPINTLKDTEIYAPGYDNGTKLALVRYPHGGTFEIPILTVNNKNKTGNEVIGKLSRDAVGVNKSVAELLSGADYDGDTVMCIPTHDSQGRVKISYRKPLDGLVGFDTDSYAYDKKTVDDDGTEHYYRNGHEFRVMKATGLEMGKITNLITDMTLLGAKDDELERAVKHSMVVIDAEKHKLDYKASEIENDIASLKKRYQAKVNENGRVSYGAGTIVSRAKSPENVDKRQGSYKINKKGTPDYDPTRPEGAKLWKVSDDLYYTKKEYSKKTGLTTLRTVDGKKVTYDAKNPTEREMYEPVEKKDPKTGEVTFTNKSGSISYRVSKNQQQEYKMATRDDAHELVSSYKHDMELLYADFANDMKSLGNKARLEMTDSGKVAYIPAAKKEYEAEVKSLMNKLTDARLNTTRERAAQRSANAEVAAKKKEYASTHNGESMKGADAKKLAQQTLTKYRSEYGSISRRERNIDITDREWEAIQAGAISETKLKQILNNTDIDKLRERATPRATNTVSEAKATRIKAMAASNYTLAEIAQKLGVSTSTVSAIINGKGVK